MEIPKRTTSELNYEPQGRSRTITVEHEGSVTRIVVVMTGHYGPVPESLFSLDVLAIVVVPIWATIAVLIRFLALRPKPPRAVFEFEGDDARIAFRHPLTGDETDYAFPKAAIREAKINRFNRGLWLDVPGHIQRTVLEDVPPEAIAVLDAEIQAVLTRCPSQALSATGHPQRPACTRSVD